MPSPITHERQPAQILEMMERLGIEPEGGVVARLGLSYTTARHRCDSCICKTECRAWIDKASALLAPRFCQNSDIFFELKFDALSCNRAFVGNA